MLRTLSTALSCAALLAFPTFAEATDCNIPSACALYRNVGTGKGIEGDSTANVGVYGTSTSSHGIDGRSSTSFGVVGTTAADGSKKATARAGVYGEDLDTGRDLYNSGVAGISTDAIGVSGISRTTGIGVFGRTYDGIGVVGRAFGPNSRGGVFGTSSNYGVYGTAKFYGVVGYAASGYGGEFFSDDKSFSGIGVLAYSKSSSAPTALLLNIAPSGGMLLEGQGLSAATVVSIDTHGNEVLQGSLTQNGEPLYRTKTTKNIDVTSYGARTASPTIEDFGTAELRGGFAAVALESTFASTIEAGSYMVFITPHGDSNGLYTETSPGGFTVHENKAGRSTLSFDYRIVAKPLDTRAARLPEMARPSRGTPIRLARLPKDDIPLSGTAAR